MDLGIDKHWESLSSVRSSEPPGFTDLEDALLLHHEWLQSGGETGHRADLSRACLAGADLTDANLKSALLHRVDLNGAELMLADLEGANLTKADLQLTNLLGTNLHHADLEGASLQGAIGLSLNQLGGANLHGAAMPAQLPLLQGLEQTLRLARRCGWLLFTALAVNVLLWIRIFSIPDARLLQNASAIPFAGTRNAIPLIPFCLFAPILVLLLFGASHLYLQRLWDAVAELPAVFPDGRRLDDLLPRFARWPARSHFV